MVTSESTRTPSAPPAYERKTQTFQTPQPAAEAVVGQPQAEERPPLSLHDPLWLMSVIVSGATIGSLGGLSAIVLAILGLSGVVPMYLLPVAAIVLGLAFLTLGGVGNAWARMFRFVEHETSRDRLAFSGGVAAVWIAGIAAVVLGLLNLAFLGDARFGAIAVILLGAGLLWHSGVMRRVSHFTHNVAYHGVEGRRPSGPFAFNALTLAPVRDFVVGLGGIILGILAMMNIAPATLGLIALLILGGALSSTASTICGAAMVTLKSACAKG